MGGADAAIPDAWREWWQNPDAEHYYFQGKDNIVFHTVIWPSMLLGYGEGGEYGAGRGELELPTNVVATEFLTYRRASSSRRAAATRSSSATSSTRYDADALRYYLVAASPETQDTDFTWAEFVRRNNDELLANWGNLVNRTLDERPPELRRRPGAGRADRGGPSALLATIDGGFDEVGVADRARAASGPRSARRCGSPPRSTSTSATRRRGRSSRPTATAPEPCSTSRCARSTASR